MMQAFYQQRVSRHQKKMMKYLKYVLNDHVVLVAIFVLGGFGFYYSTFVKTITGPALGWQLVVAFLWLMTLFVGRLATLTEEADEVFLLPKERQMADYFKAALKHSFGLPAFIQLLVVGIAMPILIAVAQATGWDFLGYLISLWLLTGAKLIQQVIECYQTKNHSKQRKIQRVFRLGLSLLIIMSGVLVHPFLAVGLAVLFVGYQVRELRKTFETANLAWERTIENERHRLHRIYKFFNLFTDVPGISGQVRRRKFLDGLLKKIPFNRQYTYFYLYCRSFLRGSEYSGLYLRLSIIGALILLFLQEFWLAFALAVVILYLIGFQLLPLYGQFDYMVLTALYPIPAKQKKDAMQQLLGYLVTLTALLFGICGALAFPTIKELGLLWGGLALEGVLFIKFYVPKRLQQMEQF